jgi:hypothetical protein
MFALAATRAADALWSGADLVVEFATLGEYRLPARRRPMEPATAARTGWDGCPDKLISWTTTSRRGAHMRPAMSCTQRPG